MSLIKKPSAIEPKRTLAALIYGQPGIGKTTLALSSPSPVLLDFDGGVNRVNGAHQVDTVQPTKWEDVTAALGEIREANYSTIVVDTLGKMMTCIEEYIKRTEPKFVQRDGTLNLKGYGKRKNIFVEFIKTVLAMGKNVVFVAHQLEEKRDDNVVVRPECGGKAGDELMKELDLVGYMQAIGQVRTIDFDPSEHYYAKNAASMRAKNAEGQVVPIAIPKVVDDDGAPVGNNNFLQTVIASYIKQQSWAAAKTAEYEALVAEGRGIATAVTNAEEANDALKWIAEANHVFNSDVVIKTALHRTATAAGLKYNKATKCYE